jgi:hypothetical protein
MKFLSKTSRQGRWIRNLVVLISALVPIFLILFGLRFLLDASALSAEWKIGLVAGTALVFLILAGFGLGLLLNRSPLPIITHHPSNPFFRLLGWWQSRDRLSDIYLAACISLAYVVPIILFQLPVWLSMVRMHIPAKQWFSAWGLTSGLPWLFIWQVICIAFYPIGRQIILRQFLNTKTPEQESRHQNTGERERRIFGLNLKSVLDLPWYIFAAGLLGGLGIALAAVFILSIETSSSSLELNTLSSSQYILLVIVALGIAPWVEELTFRGQTTSGSSVPTQRFGAILGWSALYATLLFRPLFWFPAFFLSLGLFELSRHSRSLLPAILGHFLFNAIMLLFGWWMVL